MTPRKQITPTTTDAARQRSAVVSRPRARAAATLGTTTRTASARGALSTAAAPPSVAARRALTPAVAATRLAHALDALLEEGLTQYDDRSAAGRRRMKELNAGFAAGEAALSRARLRGAAALSPIDRVRLLADVVRFILHWAGNARGIREPPETLAALHAARRALEDASGTLADDTGSAAELRNRRSRRSAS